MSLRQASNNNFFLLIAIIVITVIVYLALHLFYPRPSFVVIAVAEMITGVIIGVVIGALRARTINN